MEHILSALDWLSTNMNTIMIVMASVHALAIAIVNLTPTPADNVWLGKVYKVIEKLAGVFTAAAKLSPKNR